MNTDQDYFELAAQAVRKHATRIKQSESAEPAAPIQAARSQANIIESKGECVMNDLIYEDQGDAWAHQQEIEHQLEIEHRKMQKSHKAKTQPNYFVELSKIDVNEHVEKKGQFSYLSWAWAVDRLRRLHPNATWEVRRFNGVPYLKTECGYFVEVALTVEGVTLSQIHPVLDSRNRPLAEPNAFDINTSIQRCLVKAIALHGLGLYIYAGEDLPEGVEPATISEEQQLYLQHLIDEVGSEQAKFLNYFRIQKLSELPAAEYERAILALEKKRKAAA